MRMCVNRLSCAIFKRYAKIKFHFLSFLLMLFTFIPYIDMPFYFAIPCLKSSQYLRRVKTFHFLIYA